MPKNEQTNQRLPSSSQACCDRKKRKRLRDKAAKIVRMLFEDDLLTPIPCRVNSFGEQVIDWDLFWNDPEVKESMEVVYLALADES